MVSRLGVLSCTLTCDVRRGSRTEATGAQVEEELSLVSIGLMAAAILLHQEHPRKRRGPAQEIGMLSAGGKSL